MPKPLSRSIQDYVLRWREAPWPLPWTDVFGREAPLALEIGFGNGEFLADAAEAQADRNYVGIELSWSAARRLFQRLQKRGLTNVRAMLGDAEFALERLFAPGSLDEVFLNHPCPWPKARHHERRLMNERFLELLASRMRPGAKLTFVTDHAEFAEWAAERLEAQTALVPCHGTTIVGAIPDRKPTKYESKALAQGIAIQYFEWKRPDDAPSATVQAHEPGPNDDPDSMPSLTLDGAPEVEELFDGFEPLTYQTQNDGVAVVVRLVGAYRQLERRTWLVEALVLEDKLRQEFGLLAIDEGENLLVKLAGMGRPHPTFGVKLAVWRLGCWLRERHPTLSIRHENLGQDVREA